MSGCDLDVICGPASTGWVGTRLERSDVSQTILDDLVGDRAMTYEARRMG